ncbi:MAG: hypothetical protein HYY67_02560 [Thaumarchaeota archaeon]|nr:hypothetical protein [Nitrososphaerota archaeon]
MPRKLQSSAISPTLLREWFTNLRRELSVAMETNGRGFLGFIVELPGAFVRGRTEEEALSKVNGETRSYFRWLGMGDELHYRGATVQTHRCSLMVNDADSEILLDDDTKIVNLAEFERLAKLVVYSGYTFQTLYQGSNFKDWIDKARTRNTFYGEAPRTIREIFDHVNRTQRYYLSRTGVEMPQEEEDLMKIRRFCLEKLKQLFGRYGNSLLFDVDNEKWTIKKILRRFVWHDRIHAKAIVKILEKQRRSEVILRYSDTFHFEIQGI